MQKTFSLNYKLTQTDKLNAGRVNDLFLMYFMLYPTERKLKQQDKLDCEAIILLNIFTGRNNLQEKR